MEGLNALQVTLTALSASEDHSGARRSFRRQSPFTPGTVQPGGAGELFPYPSGSAGPVLEDWNKTEQRNKMTRGWEVKK